MFTQIILLICLITTVFGYKAGAPVRMCPDMTPRHHTDPQTSLAPYSISVQGQKINPGQSIQVSLSGKEQGKKFKGFFVQVRRIDNNETIGSFNDGSIWQTLDCFDIPKSGITHINNEDKSELSAMWTAPVDYQGKVSAWATFVESGSLFWVNVTSNVFEISGTPVVKNSAGAPKPFQNVYDKCFETKGCFGGPDGCIASRDCKHMISYVSKEDSIDFEMIGETKGWIAVGFSRDNLMGEDAVTACTVNGSNNKVTVFQSWNVPDGKDNIPLDDIQQGLSNIVTRYEDGFINCKFTHEARHTILNQYKFNLINESYFVFLGRGLMKSLTTPVRMQQHLSNPFISAVSADLKDVSEIGLASDLLIKLHGSLMIAAWVGTVGVAIFLARYFKNVWPTEKHLGEKIWFTWHRALNIFTVLLNIAAFVLIFVHLKGWSQVWQYNPHPILGVVVTFLVLLQPIMAVFRCHPGTPKRPIFNWLHFLVGNSAHILAVITLFFAKTLNKAKLPDFYMWILIAFVVFHVIVFLIMEAFTCFHGNKIRDNVIALKDMSNGNAFTMTAAEVSKNVGSRFRKILLLFYVFGIVGFVVALIATVFLSPVKER